MTMYRYTEKPMPDEDDALTEAEREALDYLEHQGALFRTGVVDRKGNPVYLDSWTYRGTA